MLGIILTLLAVLFVVVVAFYFADNPGSRPRPADPAFFDRPVRGKNRQIPH
jgi:hypothetical protein